MRPNVLGFNDFLYDGSYTHQQWDWWGAWMAQRRDAKLAVIEIGAGTAIPAVRDRSNLMALRVGAPLIRVNPYEPGPERWSPVRTISGAGGAQAALESLLAS